MPQRKFQIMAGWVAAVVLLSAALPAGAVLAGSPKDAEFYKLQWNLKAIHAHPVFSKDAEASARSGALVAVVDTGIDYLHPDLVGRVDLDLSTSLLARTNELCVPGEPGAPYRPNDPDYTPGYDPTRPTVFDEDARARALGRDEVTDFHSHGTAVSGLITSNAEKLAGVTYGATLFGVKVHGMGRANCLSMYLEGIEYAADQGADVIHMSIPLEFNRTDALVARVNATLAYARARGAILVAAAGNATANLDVGTRFRFCQPEVVFCVSATGPASADQVEEPYWDEIAAYSNFGSAIDVAGPGGTAAVPVWLTCSTVTLFSGAPQRPCREGSLIWSSTGTSFGAAATSGLAALLFRLTGRSTDPTVIESLIEQSADDVGTLGPAYYGEGRINVKQAVAAATKMPK